MTLLEYQAQALRTSDEQHDRKLNGCMGLVGESGEIVDALKKWKFQSGLHAEIPRSHLVEECGDLLWYCMELLSGLDTTVADKQYRREAHWLAHQADLGIIQDGMNLAQLSIYPYTRLYLDGDAFDATLYMAEHISVLVAHIEHFLERWCQCTLDDCMTKNIEKLKERYPEGFDPERSLHRGA